MFGSRKFENDRYLAAEVISALQKDIRRCNHDALTWSYLLAKEGYWGAAFNRLMLICSEDIGLANPFLPIIIHKNFKKGKKICKQLFGGKTTDANKNEDVLMCLFDSTMQMIASEKSRSLTSLVLVTKKELVNQIPLDLNQPIIEKEIVGITHEDTNVVKLTKGLHSFLEQKTPRKALKCAMSILLYENIMKDLKIDTKMKLSEKIWGRIFDVTSSRAYSEDEINTIWALESFYKHKPNVLFIAHAICITCRKLDDDKNITIDEKKINLTPSKLPSSLDFLHLVSSEIKTPIPDYALDKHTLKGKQMKRGIEHFFKVGAKVNNESFTDPNEKESFEWYMELESKRGTKRAKSSYINTLLVSKRWVPGICVIQDINLNSKNSSVEKKQKLTKKRKIVEYLDKNNNLQTPHKKQKIEKEKKGENKSDQGHLIWKPLEVPFQDLKSVEVNQYPKLFDFNNYIHYKSKLQILPEITNFVDAQLPCGWKPRTLIGFYKNQHVFVKGPLKSEFAQTQLWVDFFKTNISHVNPIGCCLWEDDTGIYIIMEDLISKTKSTIDREEKSHSSDVDMIKKDEFKSYPSKTSSSKRFENLAVIDSTNLNYKMMCEWAKIHNLFQLSHKAQRELIAALLFRRWLGISDCNFRNVGIKTIKESESKLNEMIYSFDETKCSWDPRPYRLFSQVFRKEWSKIILKWMYETHSDFVFKLFDTWMEEIIQFLHYSFYNSLRSRLITLKTLIQNKQIVC